MKLFYHSLGEGNPLLILHGLFGMSDNWMTAGKILSSNFKVIIPDLRNHGRSPHSELWSYDYMRQDLIELMDELKIESTFVIGHSMGGKLAMHLSLTHPEKVNKLVVVDIAPRRYEPSDEHKLVIRALSETDLLEMKTRKEVKDALATYGFDENILQFILKNLFYVNENLAWRVNFKVLGSHIEEIGAPVQSPTPYSGPTLFIRGNLSAYIKESDSESIRTLFPTSVISTIEGAGHWVHAEKPNELAEMVGKFLG